MSTWESVTWAVARAGGLTAYGLLTLSVAVGLALSLHWQSPRWPRIINNELHNFLTLLALVFTGVHVLAVAIDPFTHFGWSEIFIPFVSHYRPLWMALGIVALYLGIAIGISTWLRPRIGYAAWRTFHVLTLVLYGLVPVHGIATGTDTHNWWGVAIYVASIALVVPGLAQRLVASRGTHRHASHAGYPATTARLPGRAPAPGAPIRGAAGVVRDERVDSKRTASSVWSPDATRPESRAPFRG